MRSASLGYLPFGEKRNCYEAEIGEGRCSLCREPQWCNDNRSDYDDAIGDDMGSPIKKPLKVRYLIIT